MDANHPPTSPPPRHIWIVSGPAGCGKSSVAECLQRTFAMPFLEGDTFHTPANVQKMASGQPLTDADRADWLQLLRGRALAAALAAPPGVVLTCSALKRKYRDFMREANSTATTATTPTSPTTAAATTSASPDPRRPAVRVRFIYLHAAEAVLVDRVRARQGHYMKDYMVHSQFESLEAPLPDEADVLSVDAGGTSAEVQRLAVEVVRKAMAADASLAVDAGVS